MLVRCTSMRRAYRRKPIDDDSTEEVMASLEGG